MKIIFFCVFKSSDRLTEFLGTLTFSVAEVEEFPLPYKFLIVITYQLCFLSLWS